METEFPATTVMFKHESSSPACGPVFLTNGPMTMGPDFLIRPYEANGESAKWFTRRDAKLIAERLGLKFEEF